MNRKSLFSAAVFSVAVFGQVFADCDSEKCGTQKSNTQKNEGHRSVDARLTDLEQQMQEVSVKNAMGTVGAQFAKPNQIENDWYGEVDVLLWHAKAGGVDWAIVFNQAVLPQKGNMKTLGFDWDWGVRVGLGKYFSRDGWDLNFLYTYFKTTDSQHVEDGFTTLDDVTLTNAVGTTFGSFSGKNTYNQIDVNLGKQYFVSRSLSMHPYAGLEALWLDQSYKLVADNYINSLTTSIPVAGSFNNVVKDQNNLFGIGPKMGLDANWYLCNNFRFIGQVSGALLQGYYKVTQHQDINIQPTGAAATLTSLDLNGSKHQLFPHAKLLLGLGWGNCLKNKKQRLDISLNYETNYFWKVNQIINEVNSNPKDITFEPTQPVRLLLNRLNEDIAFYGVTLKVKLDF